MFKNAPLVQSGEKYCHRCQTAKPVSGFYRNHSTPDGHTSQCKSCARETAKQSRLTKLRLEATMRYTASLKAGHRIELPELLEDEHFADLRSPREA